LRSVRQNSQGGREMITYGPKSPNDGQSPESSIFRRTFFVIAVSAAGIGLMSGAVLAQSSDLPGIDQENKVVRVGAFAPQTGPVPFYTMINNSADAFFRDLNKKGGIDGWTVEYVIRDDGYD